MNLREYRSNQIGFALIGLFAFFLASCKKESDYIYAVDPVTVSAAGNDKQSAKSTTEFISIAYSDLFQQSISQGELIKFSNVYLAFGDKHLIEERIIQNFLNDTLANIPSVPSVAGDTSLFIQRTYHKFFNREPDAFELYYTKEQFRLNANYTPLLYYYALMTSDEYRYY